VRSILVILFALTVLSAVCLGQWTEPSDVGVDTALLGYVFSFQLAAASGDTLWALYSTFTGFRDTNYAFGHWSMGDSWSDARALAVDTTVFHLSSGVDPLGRIWLSWYNGNYLVFGDTWGIWTRVHDSLGWGSVRLALRGPGSAMEFPRGQYFAADGHGNWYMGICEEHAPLPDLYTSALYSRLQGDTWIWPLAIARGAGDPVDLDYGLPVLVARPDTGFWAVYSRSARYEQDKVLIDHLVPDSACINCTELRNLEGWTATGDSAGQMWVIYVDTLGAAWSITYDTGGEKDRRLVTTDRRSGPAVCTDQLGWVWLFWAQSDTTLLVSHNGGNGWSAPEAVTSKTGYPVDIVSDRHGRIYVCFRDTQGKYWTCYRTSRPGIGSDEAMKRLATGHRATVVHALPRDVVIFDALGRRVLNPRPGVLFVREPSAGGGRPSAIHKVVITR